MLQHMKYWGAWCVWPVKAVAHLALPLAWAGFIYFVVALTIGLLIEPSLGFLIGGLAAIAAAWAYLEFPAFPEWGRAECYQRCEGIYGNAGWAKREEVIAHELMTTANTACILGEYAEKYGPVDQPDANTKEQLGYTDEQGLVSFGPAGIGKGTTAINTTLLSSHENAFVCDVKSGENWYVSHTWREKIGHECVAFDPFNILDQFNAAYFNPLERCIARGGNIPPDFEKNLHDLADAMITTGKNADDFWGDSARALVTCIAAQLCVTPKETPTLGRLREVLGYSDAERQQFLEGCTESPYPIIKNNYAQYTEKATDNKTIRSIIQTAISQMNYLDVPIVQERLGKSTFSFDDLRRKKMTIYLVMSPRDAQVYHRLARVLVQCFMSAMYRMPAPHEHSVLAILDEQAQLGYMKSLVLGAKDLRSYRVRMWSFFQNLGQLKELYGEGGAQTFLANAGIQQFFTSNDPDTAKYVSEKTGDCTMTVGSTTQTDGTSYGPGGGSRNTGTSTNWSVQRVRFLEPQKVYGLDKRKTIIFKAGLPYPVVAWKKDYRADPVLKQRAGENPFYGKKPRPQKSRRNSPAWWPF